MGNSGYLRKNGKGVSEEPSTPPYPAGEYNDSLPPVLESNLPIERSSRVGQHLLPVGVLRKQTSLKLLFFKCCLLYFSWFFVLSILYFPDNL